MSLAKSNGIEIEDHSKLVGLFSETIAQKKQIFNNEIILKEIRCSGLLHDIAKVIEVNQNSIKKGKKMPIQPSAHNEQAWAFLSKHLRCQSMDSLNHVLYSIYWHHGTSSKKLKNTNNVIYDNISDSDKKKLVAITQSLLKDNDYFFCSEDPKDIRILPPDFYNSKNEFESSLEMFSRMCLISADRIVAKFEPSDYIEFLEDNNKISDFIDKLMLIENCDNINKIFFDNERFEIQKDIVKQDAKTICFNGPAGFGKTNTGLFWITKNKEKTIWVCPRNTVAYSVYHSIIETFKNFKIEGISVELYLTGKIQESNVNDSKDFTSDIIITNIDNFLTPSIDNRNADRLFYLSNANVIFDEYHEYVNINDNILFSCFINIMRTRHRNTKSRTLLISATPIYGIENLWDFDSEQTLYLPQKYQHYPAAHNKKYNFKISDKIPDLKNNNNSLVFLNSISSTQDMKIKHPESKIFHGDFEKHFKNQKLTELFNSNGKTSSVSKHKQNVISTHALQASADLSFSTLMESVVSAMATLQRVGRINRWGEFESADILIFNLKTKSENTIKSILYDNKLCTIWLDLLNTKDQQSMILSDIYKLYNDFCEQNQSDIKKYIEQCYSSSFDNLKYVYPIQSNSKEEDVNINNNKVYKSDANRIRANGNQIFCIYPIKDSDLFTEPFNKTVYNNSFVKTFEEEGDAKLLQKMKRAMKRIMNSQQKDIYDYSSLIKCENMETIREASKYSNTPYIVFNKIYDPEIGLK